MYFIQQNPCNSNFQGTKTLIRIKEDFELQDFCFFIFIFHENDSGAEEKLFLFTFIVTTMKVRLFF